MQISFSRFEVIAGALAFAVMPVAGFMAGAVVTSRAAPLDSELATAQELSGDVQARWIGYGCGDDGATIVTRDMPGDDCKESRQLSEVASFERPTRR
jgi:hypothetical protein